MRLQDLQAIDFNDFSSWPNWLKVVAAALICVVILVAGGWFLIKPQLADLSKIEREEETLKKAFTEKKALAINLQAYRDQMKEMEASFGVMLRQLPNKTEVPELLIDITQAGLGRGLQFVLFKPQRKRYQEFYAQLPIALRVIGNYHQLGEFVSDLAALPRIVTIGDIRLAKTGKSGGRLMMNATTSTYHYLDDEEIRARQAKKKGKKRKSRQRR